MELIADSSSQLNSTQAMPPPKISGIEEVFVEEHALAGWLAGGVAWNRERNPERKIIACILHSDAISAEEDGVQHLDSRRCHYCRLK